MDSVELAALHDQHRRLRRRHSACHDDGQSDCCHAFDRTVNESRALYVVRYDQHADDLAAKAKAEEFDFDDPELIQFKQQMAAWENSWYSFQWTKSLSVRGLFLLVSIVCCLSLAPTLLATIRSGIVPQVRRAPAIGLSGFERVVVASLLASEFDDLKQRGFEFDSNSESKLPKQSLAARWKYGWQENTVSVELIAPIAQWEKPYEEMDSHEKKRTVALRESDWPWYDCRQTNALGGDSYLLQCCLSDSLRPAETTSKLSESSWPLFDKLSPSLADEPWLYEIRIACEPGFALSIDQNNN